MNFNPRKHKARNRIILIGLGFVAVYVILLGRSFYLQVVQHEYLAGVAQNEFIKQVELSSRRGVIFDRNQEELAVSLDTDSIYARPLQISELTQVSARLAVALEEDVSKLIERLNSEKRFVWVARRVSPDKARAVKDMNFNGVGITVEPKRFYPYSNLACHLLGFVGTDARGLEGLEAQYNSELAGTARMTTNMRDALGRTIQLNPDDFANLPEGNHLILTIDKQLQYQVEKILAETVSRYNALSGQAIVMVPQTGEVLAMAVAPSFNPNIFGSFPAATYRNRSVTDTFEPGSTFKMFIIAAALNQGSIGLNQKIFCENGKWQIAGRVIHDTHEYGELTMSEIVKYSSNIGTAKIGQLIGADVLNKTLKNFGFGQATKVDLPGESKGILRTISANRPVDLANVCFGQGLAVTGLQLTSAVAAVANGGVLMRPYLVKAVVDADANLIKEIKPAPVRRAMDIESARQLTEMLCTVTETGGTGARIGAGHFRVAGKTGTAQKAIAGGYSKEDYIASFIGFFPADEPKLVIFVAIDTPRGAYYGSTVAGPAWSAIAKAAIARMDLIPPQVAAAPPTLARLPIPGTPADPGPSLRQGVMPDLRGLSLREVLKLAGAQGIELKAEGFGRVVNQKPLAGGSLNRQEKWVVNLSPVTGGV